VPDEVDGAVDEYPPELGVLALAEQLDPGPDRHLIAGGGQLRQLVVAQPVEQPDATEIR
jgi:hypothetical protein